MLAVRTLAHPPREARQSRPEHWDMGVVIPDRIPSSSARRRTAKLHLPGGLQNRPLPRGGPDGRGDTDRGLKVIGA
jgi:hypothetical protein